MTDPDEILAALRAEASQSELAARRDALLAARKALTRQRDPWNSTAPSPSTVMHRYREPGSMTAKECELALRSDRLLDARDQHSRDIEAEETRKAVEAVLTAIRLHPDKVLNSLGPAQQRFVRDAEFLVYLKALDGLILEFDRSNRFDLNEAVRKTSLALTKLQVTAAVRRELLALHVADKPSLPKVAFQRLLAATRIRYINWKAALDR